MTMMTWEQSVQWLREQPEQQELVRACYFDDPLLEAAERFWHSTEWQSIAALLPDANGQALDLGAGRGISSYALARDGWQVTALEPDDSALVGAGAIELIKQQSHLPISIVSEYSEKLPFVDNSFDIVNCRQVLHHARDLAQTCREIYRVLKPGGIMLATREHVISKHEDLQQFLDSHPLHKFYGGENAFLLEEYLSAIRLSGLKVTRIMAPLDSPINYFPMSTEQLHAFCAQPAEKIIGKTISAYLFNPGHSIGRVLIKIMLSLHNRLNQTPGRLYSFLVHKPAIADS